LNRDRGCDLLVHVEGCSGHIIGGHGSNGAITLNVDDLFIQSFVGDLLNERDKLTGRLRQTEAERDRAKSQVERLKREVARLKAMLEEAKRAGKRQAAPFARRDRKKNPKRPGRKKGHKPAHRPRPDHVDHDVDVPLEYCPCCGTWDLKARKKLAPQYVTDFPEEVKAEVWKYNNESGWCPMCKRWVQSRHPDQHSSARGAAGVQVGPRALAAGVDLKQRVGMPFKKAAQALELMSGIKVGPATLVRAEQRIARQCEPTVQALVEVARKADVAQSDETGWYITEAPKRAWLWPIVTLEPRVTLYVIRLSRGGEVAAEVLGDFAGALGVDGWAGYINLPYLKGQDMAHLLRRCAGLLEVQQRGAARFPHAVKQVLQRGMAVKKLHGELPADDYAACVDQVRGEMTAVLEGRIQEPANLRFANHLRNHEAELFTYLDVPGMPPTTALVEQEVRPAVVIRKMSGGNRTAAGAHVHEVLATVGRTAERNGKRLVDLLPALMCSVVAGYVLPLLPGLPSVVEPSTIESWVRGSPQVQQSQGARSARARARNNAIDSAGGKSARPPPA
jgi:transposase